ncbi:MAG: DUF4142 domain-containing protein [Myxococcaceae bacterium]
MNNVFRNSLIVVLAVAAPAFAQTKATDKAMDKSMKSPMMNMDEKSLLEHLHAANQHEIQLATLAKQKATNDATKQAAEMIATDHEQADKDVMALAQKKNLKLGTPTPMGEQEKSGKAMMDAIGAHLKTLDGQQFDSLYLAAMTSGHDHVIDMVSMAMKKFPTGETNDLLTKMLPKLQQHREHCYSALGQVKMGETAATGGSGDEMGGMSGKAHKDGGK